MSQTKPISEAHEKVLSLIDKEGHQLCYLYGRWQDEREYEDFAEYRKAAQEVIPYPITMTKRPFAIYFSTHEADYRLKILPRGIDIQWVHSARFQKGQLRSHTPEKRAK